MTIVVATVADLEGWAGLRAMLWSDETVEQHRAAIIEWLGDERHTAFVAIDDGRVVGFIEASLRTDHVNGCTTSPVAFVEGLAVASDRRRSGLGRRLVAAVEAWGRARGAVELGSDTDEANTQAGRLHLALGFEERERVVFYRKLIDANGSTPS